MTSVDPPAASRSAQDRLPFIQGLRAVAVLVVVAFHAGLPVPGGFIGVDIFFVISGFVITAMLGREFARTGSTSFRNFYLKRFKRLAPALALTVSVTMVISVFLLSPFGAQQEAARTGIGATLFSANVSIATGTGDYFVAQASHNPLLNTWSLSVEEQIYLVFPAFMLLLWLSSKSRRRKSLPFLITLFLGIFSFAIAVIGSTGHQPDRGALLFGFYSPFTRFWEFTAGALVALSLGQLTRINRKFAGLLSFTGLGILIIALGVTNETTPYPGIWTLLPVAATTLIIVGGLGSSNFITRSLSSTPLVRMGDWSYSIYLWHWPIIVFAAVIWPQSTLALIFAALLSFAPALLSFRYVESPLRLISTTSRKRLMSLLAITTAIPIVICGFVLIGSNHGYWIPRITSTQDQVSLEHLGAFEPCAGIGAPVAPQSCSTSTTASGTPVYLVGDSYSEQFVEAVGAAATARTSPFTRYTFGGCPLADVHLSPSSDPTTDWRGGCGKYKETTTQWLNSAQPGIVVLANAEFYFRDSSISLSDSTHPATSDPTSKLALYETGLKKTVAGLQNAGHQVLLVQPIPNYQLGSENESLRNWKGSDTCTGISLVTGSCSNAMDTSLLTITARQQSIWNVLSQVSRDTRVGLLDLRPVLCPMGRCDIVKDGSWIYKDYLHLTVGASLGLSTEFETALTNLDAK
jgi:peptidoglycan/LPS O-acetylase OafA/YrhL